MVSAQLDVAIGEAFVRLRAYAYAQDRRLSEVARDIVARRLRLSPDGDPPRISEQMKHSHPPAAPRRSPLVLAVPGGEQMDGEQLTDAFVELADTMVADFDVIDFLHLLTQRSVELLDASAAGVLLADPRGELRLVAASTEAVRVLELFQLQNDQGPCLDCFRTGQPVAAPDLTAAGQIWPQFAAAARGQALAPCRPCRCGCAIRSSVR